MCFIEELVNRFSLEDSLKEFRRRFSHKMREVPMEFYNSPGVITQNWKEPLNDLRHVITRYSLNGLHDRMCSNPEFHKPTEGCICRFC